MPGGGIQWTRPSLGSGQSGRPINIGIQGDRAGNGSTAQRPDLVGDWRGPETRFQWFNTAAFAVPATGTYGYLGRNLVIGPGTNNWDFSPQKELRVSERFQTELRIEVYNLPHHFSYFAVATTLGAANFGQVTSATDPRTLQFGMRIKFYANAGFSVSNRRDRFKNFIPYQPMAFFVVVTKPSERK